MADTILHNFAELVTILGGFAAGMLWVTRSIKNGQKEQMETHKEDFREIKKEFKSVRKELKKRVSNAECERLRSLCPCNNNSNLKGKN